MQLTLSNKWLEKANISTKETWQQPYMVKTKPHIDFFPDQWCYNWSHSLDSHYVSNPMGEFMSYGEDIVEEMYQVYKDHHNKIHDSQHEHVKRKHIFRHNMR